MNRLPTLKQKLRQIINNFDLSTRKYNMPRQSDFSAAFSTITRYKMK